MNRAIKAILPCLCIYSSVTSAAALNVFFDLNNNAVPNGWTLSHRGPSYSDIPNVTYGIANGALFARQIGSGAYLSTPYAASAGVTSLTMEWDGDITNAASGNMTYINLKDSLNNGWEFGLYYASVYQHGTPEAGIKAIASYIPDPVLWEQNISSVATFGVYYHLTAVFSDGLASFSGTTGNTTLFSQTFLNPGFTLALINEIGFGAYNTDGAGDVHTDNLHVVENITTVPEPATIWLLGSVLAGLSFATKRTTNKPAG